MTRSMSTGGLRSWLLYVAAAFMLADLPLAMAGKAPWPRAIVLGAGAVMILLGTRKVFRPAVFRTRSDEVVCRFAPWYEGYIYVGLMIALAAAGATVQGFTTGPRWFGYSGLPILALMVLGVLGSLTAGRRPFLSLTPSILAVRGSARRASATVIPSAVPFSPGLRWNHHRDKRSRSAAAPASWRTPRPAW